MRLITLIILHCTAVTPFQTSSVEQINEWHLARGWANGCGYHYVIRRDGTIEKGRPDEMIGAHCLHHNKHSIGVAYEGGLNENSEARDTRTEAQKKSMLNLLTELKKQHPNALIKESAILSPIYRERYRFLRCTSASWQPPISR